jgi:hypothetical protein
MNNKIITMLALVSALATVSTHATSVNFTVNTGWVYDGATEITKVNSGDYSAFGVFGDISGYDFTSGATLATDLAGAGLTLAANFSPPPIVFSSTYNSGSAGNAANLIIFNGADLASATSFGALTSSGYVTLGLGTTSVSFTSTDNWNTAYAGTLTGSDFTLASAVPEPSTFAALAGLCALGVVMVRRRRA